MSKISKFPSIKDFEKIRILGCLFLLIAFSYVSTANAFVLMDYKWPQTSTTFYVDIPGADGLWNDAFEGAMYEWGAATVFEFYIVRGEYADPCNSFDNRNGVGFSSAACGDSWGSTTLAITSTLYIDSTITETDIVFNSNESWNVYWTSWSSYPWNGVSDFRRVAVHELGHALGLGHEDSGVSTIMNTYADNTTIPQQDDINGVAVMYDDYIPCTYSLSPTRKSVLSGGISSSIYVDTANNCNWTASESLNWVTITSGASRAGSGSVYYTVAPNTTNIQRSGTITIAGENFTISQAADPLTPVVTNWFGFDESYYLGVKLSALSVLNSDWESRDITDLKSMLINDYAITPEEHYNQYGWKEGLNPNRYFKQSEYITAKATAMYNAGGYLSVEAAKNTFNAVWKQDPYQHYLLYGASEGLNPSNNFDESDYFASKLATLQADPNWTGKSVDDLRNFFTRIGITALNHYLNYGQYEGLTAFPVPLDERVY